MAGRGDGVVVRDYGEPQRRGLDMDAPCPRYGWPNTVVCARSEEVAYEAHLGPLSLKTVRSGRELSEVGAARYAVTPQRYLLLNDGQRHAHRVEEATEVFTLMFRAGLAEEVRASLTTGLERLLDDPKQAPPRLQFFERTYPNDAALSELLGGLRVSLEARNMTQDELEQRFHPILERLLQLHAGLRQEIARLPAVRYATKLELYRRLYRARDFVEASFTEDLDLQKIAAVANLSPHHCLRLFKRVFGETPHKYLTRKRLEHAKALLLEGERSVTDICFDVGFESLGSFSLLFKKQVGMPPSAFRAAPAYGHD